MEVHFSIDGEWLTDFIRTGWSEGRYQWAMDTLDASGCPAEYHNDVLRGNLKMVGVNELYIAKDDWQPDLDMCHQCSYPDPDEIFQLASEGEKYKKLYFERLRLDFYSAKKQIQRKANGDGYYYIRTFPEEFIRTLPIVDQDFWRLAHREVGASPVLSIPGVPTLDEYMEHQRELSTKAAPEPDTEFKAEFGWITPVGKFYPCAWYEHDWLADVLGKTVGEAEAAGWIRVGRRDMGKGMLFVTAPQKEATQRQIDSVWGWCKKHDVRIPEWMKG